MYRQPSYAFLDKLKEFANDPKGLWKSRFWQAEIYQEICLFKGGKEKDRSGKSYSLKLAQNSMNHGAESSNLRGFYLQYLNKNVISELEEERLPKKKDWKTFPEGSLASGHVFMPLGWLVEIEGNPGEKSCKRRTTNYAVLVNLGTQPISLWLAYDYCPIGENLVLMPRCLNNMEYSHPGYSSKVLILTQRTPFLEEYGPKPHAGSNFLYKLLETSDLKVPASGQGPMGADIPSYRSPIILESQLLAEYHDFLHSTDYGSNILLREYGTGYLSQHATDTLDKREKDKHLQQMLWTSIRANRSQSLSNSRNPPRKHISQSQPRTKVFSESKASKKKTTQDDQEREANNSRQTFTNSQTDKCSNVDIFPTSTLARSPSYDSKVSASSAASVPYDQWGPNHPDNKQQNAQPVFILRSYSANNHNVSDEEDKSTQLVCEASQGSDSSDRSEAQTNDTGITVPAHSFEQPSSTEQQFSSDEQGFFGLPCRFDVALLTRDITEWTEDGLIKENMKKCLECSHMEIGPTLCARAVGKSFKIGQQLPPLGTE